MKNDLAIKFLYKFLSNNGKHFEALYAIAVLSRKVSNNFIMLTNKTNDNF